MIPRVKASLPSSEWVPEPSPPAKRPAVIGIVALGYGELVGLSGLGQLRSRSKQQGVRSADGIGVEAHVRRLPVPTLRRP